MQSLDTIHGYLRTHSEEIGKRILASTQPGTVPTKRRLYYFPGWRAPYPAQTLVIMSVSKRWLFARNVNVGGVRLGQNPHRAGKHVGP